MPLIVVKDELESGLLLEAEQLPDLVETFYAVTVDRRFPNPVLRSLMGAAKAEALRAPSRFSAPDTGPSAS